MGAWGVKPWDNDTAADWFMDLFDKTKLAQYVEETLRSELTDSFNYPEIRAAAYMVIVLGHWYIWPNELKTHLALAVSRLQEIVDKGCLDEDPEAVTEVKKEIAILASRLSLQR